LGGKNEQDRVKNRMKRFQKIEGKRRKKRGKKMGQARNRSKKREGIRGKTNAGGVRSNGFLPRQKKTEGVNPKQLRNVSESEGTFQTPQTLKSHSPWEKGPALRNKKGRAKKRT